MKSFGRLALTLVFTGFLVPACAPSDSGSTGSGGSKAGTGGSSNTGSGGSTSSGGATSSSGGSTSSGGAVGSGGAASGSGGAASGSGGAASGSGGAAAGTGGASAGTGGASAGTGGGSAGGGGGRANGGGSGTAGNTGGGGTSGGATFTDVAKILGTSCGTGQCHQANGPHVNLVNDSGLFARIVNGKPNGTNTMASCKTMTLVVPSSPSTSVISQIIKAKVTGCSDGRMPNMCSTTSTNPRACLTTAQISTIDSWIMAGATM